MPYKLTPQNRVSVPKHIQIHLGIKPGDKINYLNLPDGSVQMTMSKASLLSPTSLSTSTKRYAKL